MHYVNVNKINQIGIIHIYEFIANGERGILSYSSDTHEVSLVEPILASHGSRSFMKARIALLNSIKDSGQIPDKAMFR